MYPVFYNVSDDVLELSIWNSTFLSGCGRDSNVALAQLHNDGLPHDLRFSLSSFERKIREIDDTYKVGRGNSGHGVIRATSLQRSGQR